MLNLKFKNRKGNSAVEYAFLIAVVIGALIGMQAYLKRPICQRWRLAGDAFGFGRQYGMVEAPDPPDPPVTDGITLEEVYIGHHLTPVSILDGVDVDLTAEEVEKYYNPLLADGVLTLTPFEFHDLFGWGVAVEHGEQYWICWIDDNPHYGVINIAE